MSQPRLDRAWAEAFAHDWVATWNKRDIDGVVSHYAPDAIFISPVAETRTGSPRVTGPEALRAYWAPALAYREFIFEFERIAWDELALELVLTYRRRTDGKPARAVEFFRFRPDGLVIYGEAMYGASTDH